jgi:hypothetical protein
MKHVWLLLLLAACGQNNIEISYTPPKAGINGTNGANALVNIIPSAPTCAAGGYTLISGTDIDYNGIITPADEHIQTMTICNGINGADGITPAYSFVSSIVACPANTSAYREVLLCLQNGKILGSFSANMNGDQTRLSFLPTGSYINTDGSSCLFNVSVTASGSMVSWSGGSQLCPAN